MIWIVGSVSTNYLTLSLMVHEPVSGLPQLPGTAAAGSIDRECGPNVPSYMLRPVKGHRYQYSTKDSRECIDIRRDQLSDHVPECTNRVLASTYIRTYCLTKVNSH